MRILTEHIEDQNVVDFGIVAARNIRSFLLTRDIALFFESGIVEGGTTALKMHSGSSSSQALFLCPIFRIILLSENAEITRASLLEQFASTGLLTSLETALDIHYEGEKKAGKILAFFAPIIIENFLTFGYDGHLCGWDLHKADLVYLELPS